MHSSPQPDTNTSTTSLGANPGYALGQLARALLTTESHEDSEVRARAALKVEAWSRVFHEMLSGALQIGSRLPVADTPAWATLEVLKGGFATGRLLAGGELQPHEHELLAQLPLVPAGNERAAFNAYFLGEQGLEKLQGLLSSGCYRIHLPEEGALLVVAWLLRHGQAEAARNLLDEIGPYFARLRFYPVPAPCSLSEHVFVHLKDVGAVIADLQAVRPSLRFERQKEAIRIWTPLYDRVVELFVETVNGPLPTLRLGTDDKPLRSETGKFVIDGGWPCQHYPDGWKERAAAVLEDYRRLRGEHQLCASPESAHSGFATLRRYLERCLNGSQRLTGRDVGMIRSILAGLACKRRLPNSEHWRWLRAHQQRQIAGPSRADLARLLIHRLSDWPPDQGLSSLDEVLAPTDTTESERFRVPADTTIPEGLAVKVRRCLEAPVEVLVAQGIIPSAEVLAQVVPQMTAQVQAAGIVEGELRRLYTAIYVAFRRRRSLLLLNLQSQVKLHELPWVRAMDCYRGDSGNNRKEAYQTLKELVLLALTAFPQQILPNKLLQEVRALADSAELRLPIVEELAADIFMGELSEKYLHAARKAAELLEGTLYEGYYGLPYARVRRIDDVKPSRFGTPTSSELGQLCMELAGEAGRARSWSVARNGKIIEQVQILTTHNLAVLFDALGLTEDLGLQLEELALRCFHWLCRRLQQKNPSWRAQLQAVKNCAYAWRQMIFFLTLAPVEGIASFLAHAEKHLREQPAEFQTRFRPALTGLERAVQGLPVEAPSHLRHSEDSRRFLGWTTEKHWLLA